MNDKKKDKKISKKKVIDIIVTIVACVIDLCVCIYTISNIHNNINIMKPFSILFGNICFLYSLFYHVGASFLPAK